MVQPFAAFQMVPKVQKYTFCLQIALFVIVFVFAMQNIFIIPTFAFSKQVHLGFPFRNKDQFLVITKWALLFNWRLTDVFIIVVKQK